MPATDATRPERSWRRCLDSWNAFWFTPRDPTLLGLIRITCGLITLYSLSMYSFALDEFLGPQGWIDQKAIEELIFDRPIQIGPLNGQANLPRAPATQEQDLYGQDYQKKFGEWPPPPYPETKREADYCEQYRMQYGFDLRRLGLPPPQTDKQWKDLVIYTETWKSTMPPRQSGPAYPVSDQEIEDFNQFIRRYNVDPRSLYARGATVFTLWLSVHDPAAKAALHALFLTIVLLFTLGVGTRVTAFLTWFIMLNYIHRNTVALFGVDTMMTILLLYLMISPCGAALSLDRLWARWRKGRQSGGGLAPAEAPVPSVAANVAVRLLQIHLCIIYGMAGLSKLQGPAWWNGSALWYVLANFEFAPMNWPLYDWLLRQLGHNQLVFELVLTGGAYFTLAFEILYPILIWRPSLRWVFLSAALLLHGVIGIFMGLGTFALIMLVMNLAFLPHHEIRWLLELIGITLPPERSVA